MAEMSDFAERLLRLRIAKKWTQAALASAMGCSRTLVVKWESDSRAPTPMAMRLLECLERECLDGR